MGKNIHYLFLSSCFPKRSETFVYDQFRLLKKHGLPFTVISNRRPEKKLSDMDGLAEQTLCLEEVGKARLLKTLWRWKLRHPILMLRWFFRALRMEAPLRVSMAQMAGATWLLEQFKDKKLHVHAHFAYGGAGVALWLWRMGGVPYSLTLHGSDLLLDAPDLPMKLEEATHLVTISRYNKDFIRKFYSAVETPVSILPLGVKWPETLPEHPAYEFGYPLQLLNVGRMIAAKGQRYLIEACAELKERGVPFHCTIAGDGPLRDALKGQIEAAGLKNQFTLPGASTHAHIISLYQKANVYVHPSVSEGIPVVLMEAMRGGVPVIATNITGIPELVEDGVSGMLVPPENPIAIADQLQAIYSGHCETAPLTEAARNFVCARYNLENNTLAFKELLEDIQR